MNREQREELTEQWLDTALERYGAAEPSAGLESRILVRVEAERRRRSSFPVTRFRLLFGLFPFSVARAPLFAALVALLIATAGITIAKLQGTANPRPTSESARLAGIHRSGNGNAAQGNNTQPTKGGPIVAPRRPAESVQLTEPSAGGAAFQLAQGGSPGTRAQARQPRRGGTTSNTQPAIREWPRRDQFPSPTPLTEEERLLLTYLRTTPKEELLLIAQRQAAWRNGQEQMRNLDNPPAANGLGMAEPDETH